jgi:large subunit ribosomal protein L15
MSTILAHLSPSPGSTKVAKRLGRGVGSGLGKTCGKGTKGQKKRHGGNFGKLHFQGGQTPIQRRLPKRGFNVPFPVFTVALNLADLERFDAGAVVNEAALRASRLVQGRGARIKILGDGELTKKLTVEAHAFSASASQKIEAAGGKAVVIETTVPPKTASAS